ncbi:MAG: co-chaperone GroES [Acidimicrobiia bacterium]|nr:co-chaperone GroES [Acidimicrobiia bacterium]
MDLQPLDDRIVLKAHDAEAETASGLAIPDTAQERPQHGDVLAVGAGRRDDTGSLIPMDVKQGDVVVHPKYGGTEVTVDGDELLIMPARDILAIVK